MSNQDAMKLLQARVAEQGQAAIARQLGISASALNQLLHGNYKAAPDAILQRVREVFGSEIVACPVLGDIPLGRCSEERKHPMLVNSIKVRLFRACQKCPHNGGKP